VSYCLYRKTTPDGDLCIRNLFNQKPCEGDCEISEYYEQKAREDELRKKHRRGGFQR